VIIEPARPDRPLATHDINPEGPFVGQFQQDEWNLQEPYENGRSAIEMNISPVTESVQVFGGNLICFPWPIERRDESEFSQYYFLDFKVQENRPKAANYCDLWPKCQS
jgi:hypothetical protein